MSGQGWIIVLLCGIIGGLAGVLHWVWHSRYDEGVKAGMDLGREEGKRLVNREICAERVAAAKAQVRLDKLSAELAKDRAAFKNEKAAWEQDHVMRVAAVPYGVTPIRAVCEPTDPDHWQEAADRLVCEVLRLAKSYVELESYEEPMYYGRRYRATLYVARRSDLK